MLHAVITTIQNPTRSVERLAERIAGTESRLVIAGDTKGPSEFDLSAVAGFKSDQLIFLPIGEQLTSEFTIRK